MLDRLISAQTPLLQHCALLKALFIRGEQA